MQIKKIYPRKKNVPDVMVSFTAWLLGKSGIDIRFGYSAFIIINIPDTWGRWCSNEIFAIYLIGNTVLAVSYCLV